MIPVGRVSYPTVLIVFKYSSGLDLIIKIKISEKFIKYENPIGFFRIGIPIQGNVKYYALLMIMLYNEYPIGDDRLRRERLVPDCESRGTDLVKSVQNIKCR